MLTNQGMTVFRQTRHIISLLVIHEDMLTYTFDKEWYC